MSCSVHTALPAAPAVAVSVNGVAIARDAIAREMQFHPADKPIAAWQQAARALVIRELLLQKAREAGITPQPLADGEGRRETEEEAMVRGLIEQEVAVPEPDDHSCRRYFERNRAQFRSPDIFEASHILFAAVASDAAAYEQARNDAAAVLVILREQPQRFSELARQHSGCNSAQQDGNLGQISSGQTTPEFEQALMAMTPGTLSDAPVATRYGFHIIRLDRKHEGRELPYEAVAGWIAGYLSERVRRRAEVQYVARLVSQAQIEGITLAGADAQRVH